MTIIDRANKIDETLSRVMRGILCLMFLPMAWLMVKCNGIQPDRSLLDAIRYVICKDLLGATS